EGGRMSRKGGAGWSGGLVHVSNRTQIERECVCREGGIGQRICGQDVDQTRRQRRQNMSKYTRQATLKVSLLDCPAVHQSHELVHREHVRPSQRERARWGRRIERRLDEGRSNVVDEDGGVPLSAPAKYGDPLRAVRDDRRRTRAGIIGRAVDEGRTDNNSLASGRRDERLRLALRP